MKGKVLFIVVIAILFAGMSITEAQSLFTPNPPDGVKEVSVFTDLSWQVNNYLGQWFYYKVVIKGVGEYFVVGDSKVSVLKNKEFGCLKNGLTYEWRVIAWDGVKEYASRWWKFSTEDVSTIDFGRLVLLNQNFKKLENIIVFSGQVQCQRKAVYWAPRLVITGPGLVHWDRVQSWRWTQPNEVVEFEFRVPVSEFQPGKEYHWYFHPLTKLGLEGFASTEKIFNLASDPLLRVYPNPFNPVTTIEFNVDQASKVRLSVYTTLGREVVCLMKGFCSAGQHRVMFNASHLPSGIYILRFSAGDFVAKRRITLVK